jgi:anaerobic ribonucleoside-triphosphate reductase activating protein
MRLAGIIPNSLTNGEGMRMVIFFQGCPHHCPECHNPSTWDFNGGVEMTLDEVKAKIGENFDLIDGITLSGGEPFAQAKDAAALAAYAKQMGLSVWSYTGYKYEDIAEKNEFKELLQNINTLVDGPFIKELKDENLKYRGSNNQRILNLYKGQIGSIWIPEKDEFMVRICPADTPTGNHNLYTKKALSNILIDKGE